MNAPGKNAMPPPIHCERDADGRLIGLSVDGRQGIQPNRGNDWLIAVDGSGHSLQAVAEAAQLAGKVSDCTLHLINVQPWLGKEAAESELAARGWSATEQARSLLDTHGMPWRLHIAMGDAAGRIVALASELGMRGIVVGSRGLGAAENLLVGSVAYKVIHLSPVSVLVVR